MMSLLVLLAAVLPITQSLTPTAPSPMPSPLAPGRHVYVVRGAPRDDLADALTRELKAWGRWSVVERQEDAELFATIGGKGSNQTGTVTITITREIGGPTLWQSEDTGHRWYRNGKSAFLRAFETLIERLKEAANSWPQS